VSSRREGGKEKRKGEERGKESRRGEEYREEMHSVNDPEDRSLCKTLLEYAFLPTSFYPSLPLPLFPTLPLPLPRIHL